MKDIDSYEHCSYGNSLECWIMRIEGEVVGAMEDGIGTDAMICKVNELLDELIGATS